MKFTNAALLLACAATTSVSAFAPIQHQRAVSTSTSSLYSTAEKTEGSAGQGSMSPKKEDRLNFMKNEQFHRRGFKEVRDQVEQSIEEQYQSDIVDELKSSNYVIEKDGVKVYLAKVR